MIDGRVVDDPMAQQRPILHQSQHCVSSQPAASRLVDCADEEPPCSACPRARAGTLVEYTGTEPRRAAGAATPAAKAFAIAPSTVSCFVPLRPKQPAAFRIEDRAMLSNLAVRDIETLV